MTDTPLLTKTLMRLMAPYLPKSRGRPRVDDRRAFGDPVRDPEWPALARRTGRF